MRLIDADALQKEFEELASNQWNQETGTSWANGFAEAADRVADAPTVDAVEVVRCKYCIHCRENGGEDCPIENHKPIQLNGFCHFGERRTEE